jgi:hypothetical protein
MSDCCPGFPNHGKGKVGLGDELRSFRPERKFRLDESLGDCSVGIQPKAITQHN